MFSSQSIVLHWYPFSPFAQKVSWALNYKNVDFKTVLISQVEPRPERRPIDGGYRMTPVLQIGNHTFCDTKIIFAELERRFPEPSFYPAGPHGEPTESLIKSLAFWTDNSIFTSGLTQLPVDSIDDTFLNDRGELFKMDLDRNNVKANAAFFLPSLKSELDILQDIISERNENGNKWALGTNTLSLLDLHVAMSSWFIVKLLGKDWLSQNFEKLNSHLEKTLTVVRAEEVELKTEIEAKEAIAIAKREKLDVVEAIHNGLLPIKLGEKVSVIPKGTAVNPCVGTLVASTSKETIIRYENKEYESTVYIHFPVIGYAVVPIK